MFKSLAIVVISISTMAPQRKPIMESPTQPMPVAEGLESSALVRRRIVEDNVETLRAKAR